MGRNRNRVPQYQHLSKDQYLNLKHIPPQTPLQKPSPEIAASHHSTIITLNPFSKEKGLFLPKIQNSSLKDNTSTQVTKEKTIKTQESSRFGNFLSEENEFPDNHYLDRKDHNPINAQNSQENVKTEEEEKIVPQFKTRAQKSDFLANQTHTQTSQISKIPQMIIKSPKNLMPSFDNARIVMTTENTDNASNRAKLETNSVEEIQDLLDQKSGTNFPQRLYPYKTSQSKTPQILQERAETHPENRSIAAGANKSFQSPLSPSKNKNPSYLSPKSQNARGLDSQTPAEIKKSPEKGKTTLSKPNKMQLQSTFQIFHQEPQPQFTQSNLIKHPIQSQRDHTKSDSHRQHDSPINQVQSPNSPENQWDYINSASFHQNSQHDSPINQVQSPRSPNLLQASIHSQALSPSNKEASLKSNSPRNQSPGLKESKEKSQIAKKLTLSQNFDQAFNNPNYPKSPSRFSPSPKLLKEIEKASSEVSVKIQQCAEYRRSFIEKPEKANMSEFELKAQLLELKDSLNQEMEKTERLEGELEVARRTEEVLEARIMSYKETCEVCAEEINEIKVLQERFGSQLSRVWEIDKVSQTIQDFEGEILALLKEFQEKELDTAEKYETVRRELEIRRDQELTERGNQMKIMENIRLLEEEISEFQRRRDSLENPNVSTCQEKENWSPQASSPAKREHLSKSPFDRHKLLEILEGAFESKISSFNILFEKSL